MPEATASSHTNTLHPPSSAPRSPVRAHAFDIANIKWLPDVIATPLFGNPLAPTPEEWARVEWSLSQGDASMDKVVEWMFANGAGRCKAQFDQALIHGIDSLDNPPAELREFFALIDQPPAWLDHDHLAQGAKFAALGAKINFFVLRDMALMRGYALFNSMNQTLASSTALRKNTRMRLGETGKWIYDVTEPGGMSRFGSGFITTIRVRLVHALVRRNLRLKPEWDANKWGLPINQIDMLSTYLAFGPVALLGIRLFGVPVSRKEAGASLHLWRYIGWLMGVDEHWLVSSEGDGLRKLYHTFLTHRLPDGKIRQLGDALKNEPLESTSAEYKYPAWGKFVRWYRYQRHLSNSALILGPVQRQRLGIPLLTIPWYPLLSAPFRFCYLSFIKLRGDKALDRYLEKSRDQQRKLLLSYFGSESPDIIRPQQGHPAHVSTS